MTIIWLIEDSNFLSSIGQMKKPEHFYNNLKKASQCVTTVVPIQVVGMRPLGELCTCHLLPASSCTQL